MWSKIAVVDRGPLDLVLTTANDLTLGLDSCLMMPVLPWNACILNLTILVDVVQIETGTGSR